mmetsp:Transcript_6673/g.16333  ORF Transcript_6673/g.16333 Transcript_6673/m.16333 type:complete len:117 (-) Transcript_6673:1425-1775(-)
MLGIVYARNDRKQFQIIVFVVLSPSHLSFLVRHPEEESSTHGASRHFFIGFSNVGNSRKRKQKSPRIDVGQRFLDWRMLSKLCDVIRCPDTGREIGLLGAQARHWILFLLLFLSGI